MLRISHTTTFGFRNDDRLQKGAEVDEAFARVALAIDQTIRNGECRHQMQNPMPTVAWGLVDRMLMYGWTGSLLCLPRLDAGFLIRTDDPDTLLEQGRSPFIQVEDWASTHQERLRILNMLPTSGARQGRICSAASQRPMVLAEISGKQGVRAA
jgi:hypothetical protein